MRIILSIIMILTAILGGCNGNSSIVDPPGIAYNYTLNGVFVQDVNLSIDKVDYNYFAAKMTRNLTSLSSAQLFFGNYALIFDKEYNVADSVYTFSTAVQTYKRPALKTINIADSTLFADTISTAILDSLWITNDPDLTGPNTNGTPVPLVWTAVSGISGYVVAVVLDSNAYTGVGYSAYVTDLSPSTTIPRDAFLVNNVLDTGWYNIYVYAYVGRPDMILSSEILPVPFPTQLADNIAHTSLTGHFGSISVSMKKMIHVVSN